ncbi:hypothetical protein M422DRAFT_250109 [Sphaerobolus stellatus SS14]|nr:hypothetical protein M422DRAFT_250109 [Sphaerobolus stellatus SS14]
MGRSPVQDGVYYILMSRDQALTLPQGGMTPFGAAVLLPQTKDNRVANGNVTIQGGDGGLYLGYRGDEPAFNAICIGVKNPFEWRLQETGNDNTYQVIIPGGPLPDEEVEACLDLSLLRIFPPVCALRPLDAHNTRQSWTFTKV